MKVDFSKTFKQFVKGIVVGQLSLVSSLYAADCGGYELIGDTCPDCIEDFNGCNPALWESDPADWPDSKPNLGCPSCCPQEPADADVGIQMPSFREEEGEVACAVVVITEAPCVTPTGESGVQTYWGNAAVYHYDVYQSFRTYCKVKEEKYIGVTGCDGDSKWKVHGGVCRTIESANMVPVGDCGVIQV